MAAHVTQTSPEPTSPSRPRFLVVSGHLAELRASFGHCGSSDWDADFVTPSDVELALGRGPAPGALVVDLSCPVARTVLGTSLPGLVHLPRIALTADRSTAGDRLLPGVNSSISRSSTRSELESLLARAASLFSKPEMAAAQAVLAGIERLPTIPESYWDLRAATLRPDVMIADVAEILEGDPSMSLEVLALVNSAAFALRRPIVSVRQACVLLGLDAIRGLVLSSHVFSSSPPACSSFSMLALQAHSLTIARLAAQLATDVGLTDDAFSTGVLHEIGSLVLAIRQPREHERLSAERSSADAWGEREREEFGTTHAHVGACLLARWGLPFDMVEAVALHHGRLPPARRRSKLATVLHLAEGLLPDDDGVDPDIAADPALEPHVPRWRALARAARGAEQGKP